MLSRPAQPELTYTKFAPARPDKAIKWVGAQIWFGPARSEGLLVADCIDEDWAKSLALACSGSVVINAKLAAANQFIRDLLASVSASAIDCKLTDPSVSEALTALITNTRVQAKKAGFNVA